MEDVKFQTISDIEAFESTPIEERKLEEKFGPQYEEYMQNTGRYLPKLF